MQLTYHQIKVLIRRVSLENLPSSECNQCFYLSDKEDLPSSKCNQCFCNLSDKEDLSSNIKENQQLIMLSKDNLQVVGPTKYLDQQNFDQDYSPSFFVDSCSSQNLLLIISTHLTRSTRQPYIEGHTNTETSQTEKEQQKRKQNNISLCQRILFLKTFLSTFSFCHGRESQTK